MEPCTSHTQCATLGSMRTRSLNHSVYQTQYHIVWGTRYRRMLAQLHPLHEGLRGVLQEVLRLFHRPPAAHGGSARRERWFDDPTHTRGGIDNLRRKPLTTLGIRQDPGELRPGQVRCFNQLSVLFLDVRGLLWRRWTSQTQFTGITLGT
jgi:hypothetical protein